MAKDELYITKESLERMGVELDQVIKYLESIRVKDLRPVHVKAYHFLKRELVSS